MQHSWGHVYQVSQSVAVQVAPLGRQTAEALPETVCVDGTTRNQLAQHSKQCRGRLMAARLELVKAPSSFLHPDADALSRTLKCSPSVATNCDLFLESAQDALPLFSICLLSNVYSFGPVQYLVTFMTHSEQHKSIVLLINNNYCAAITLVISSPNPANPRSEEDRATHLILG